MGRFGLEAVEMLQRLSPRRSIPVMLGEYNISWTWGTRGPRMTSHKSAVFDALVLSSTAQAWNEKDGIYGKTDNENKRRPAADVLHLFNRYLVGRRAATTTSDEKALWRPPLWTRRKSSGHF